MKKTFSILISSIISITLLAGCAGLNRVPDMTDNNKDLTKPARGITFNHVPYTVIHDYNSIPKKLNDALGEYREDHYTLVAGEKESQYLLIYLGMRPTGGYWIDILSVEDVEGRISVVYKEVKPGRDKPVTDAIEYPWIALKIESNLPIDPKESFHSELLMTPIDFVQIDEANLPENMKYMAQNNSQGFYVGSEFEKESQYIFLLLGWRPTGGFAIEVKEVNVVDDGYNQYIEVLYREIQPAQGDMVTEAITYPWVAIKVNSLLTVEAKEIAGENNSAIEPPKSLGKYEPIDNYDSISKDIVERIEEYRFHRGFQPFMEENLVFISLGEKNTGGYGIEILDIEDKGDKILITIKEIEPQPGDMVIQVISYPSVLIRAKTYLPVVVVNQDGEKLNQFDLGTRSKPQN